MIKCAAIKMNDKIYTGINHAECRNDIALDTGKPMRNAIQGFVNDEGKFLTRDEAAKEALSCGQIEKLNYHSTMLFSEDLKIKDMGYTTDRNDPRLGRGVDTEKTEQHEVYLVLSEEERAKGFVRPVRKTYVHTVCGGSTTMGDALAETYARDPKFYGATYCVHCKKHLPVDEFVWDGTNEKVGS